MGRFIILSGPSCVGKGPLVASLRKFYPELTEKLTKLVLFNSRSPRPGEVEGVDYYFRDRKTIEEHRDCADYYVCQVRADLQAIDIKRLRELLQSEDVFFEGNPIIIDPVISRMSMDKVELLKVFLSPLSSEEIIYFQTCRERVDLRTLITDIMRRKLLSRTQRQKGILSLRDLEDIEKRATSAPDEMKYAGRFDYVISNHDGEDSINWDAFYYPVGDAKRTLDCFAAILQRQSHPAAEKWSDQLLSSI